MKEAYYFRTEERAFGDLNQLCDRHTVNSKIARKPRVEMKQIYKKKQNKTGGYKIKAG